ncbi:hypothetical protein IWW36_000359 [Coemansia brasiliensis]|uniref:SH3 domain-containing protein n=1 Tax=Coemansia brasiliensis TaxID=2650707 RepID=A0A9W8IDF4_9FUNG|nr:hypothetical protein IWW36_000359 [Coemansia brasiliensis]
MIAPEGVRDGRYFAEALYTFAGEGVEDLPFKKGDLIEVLDCADANWWRGKIANTDEDGLFPACLVKFTDAPVAETTMKTAERLAHLSDVLTPSYAKGSSTAELQSNDENSIESLLLNLANNEMQVQQQKVQAHMPRKPTRMKLLYEDHSQSGTSGRSSSAMSGYQSSPKSNKQPSAKPSGANSANTNSPRPPLPSIPQRTAQKSDVGQTGLWSSRSSMQSFKSSFTSSFTSSIESMREQNARTEEANRNRSSGSMLFGPRGMPGSRSSSRAQDAFVQSFASLYSTSDQGTVGQSRAAHEAAISEARQLMDGIPSPTEHGVHTTHEADYLFDDEDDDEEEVKEISSKLQSMISPASESSARFASYSSTVSSQASESAKRLPTIPSTANNSIVSDTSSCGLAGIGSAGDLTQLHRSWYSSTDSLNLAGGGALKSPGIADDDADGDVYAPRMAKTKSRIRPTTGTVRMSEALSGATTVAPATTSPPPPAGLEDTTPHIEQPYMPPNGQPQMMYDQYGNAHPINASYAPVQPMYMHQPMYVPQSGYATPPAMYTGYGQPMSAYTGQPMMYGNQAEPVQASYHDPMYGSVSNGAGSALQAAFIPPVSTDSGGFARPRSYTVDAQTIDPRASPQTLAPSQHRMSMAAPQSIPAAQMQRPASFDGGSSLSGLSNTLTSAGGPGQSIRGSVRSNTPSGFGSMSSTPPASFVRREGGISPYPSNIGTVSASTAIAGAAAPESSSPTKETTKNMTRDISVDELDPRLKQELPENITAINYVKTTRPVFKYGGHITHPETMDWSKVDRQMSMLRVTSAKLTVEVLATMHVGRPFNRPIERVRAVFIWIASNVQYDTSTTATTEEFEQQEEPAMVLQRRRSRGPGFAYLFDAMMSALGIEAHTVRGYLRQPLDTCRGAVLPAANHVWNVVCLDGEYRIVDTACAARSHPLNAESSTDTWFFLAPPREAIFTHFPLEAQQQFVDPVVPLPAFWMLPYVRPAFFTCRIKLLNLPQAPRIALKDDQVVPLVLCVRDATLGVFAEVELHDPNGSGRIIARQPLLAQCMDYRGKRMVKVLVSVRASDAHGLIKIYCGTRVPLRPKRPDASPPRAHKVLGFLNPRDRRAPAHDYSRIRDVDEDGSITTVATARTFPLVCALPVTHTGRNNAVPLVQPNAITPNEFYIKEPTSAQLHLGESVLFHLLPVGDERLFHMQLRSPSGQQFKFVYQPSDQGYVLRHTVKERGAWIIIFHSDSEGWMPIASYNCT